MSNFLDLPTHLPNTVPEKAEEPRDIEAVTNVSTDGAKNVPGSTPICIPGTNITLITEEDIQKWIEERRKRWPTKKNIEANAKSKDSSSKRSNEFDEPNPKRKTQICRFYQKNKSCKFGNKCKNRHELDSDYKVINGLKVRIPKRFENEYYVTENPSERSSLFKMLMKKEQYELENSKFIEFLKYLDSKGLINHDYDESGNKASND